MQKLEYLENQTKLSYEIKKFFTYASIDTLKALLDIKLSIFFKKILTLFAASKN